MSGIIPNIINGEITGEVLVDGKSIIGQKLAQTCRKVGVVLQNADSQIIHKTVDDEIAFGCENFALAADKIGAQIDRVCTIVELDKTAQTRTLSEWTKTTAYNRVNACDGTAYFDTRRAACKSRRRERKSFNGYITATCKGRVRRFGSGA